MSENPKPIEHPHFGGLLESYRESIRFRYSRAFREELPEYLDLPETSIQILLDFFLMELYPSWEERKRLDSAFEALGGFVRHPTKLWGILGNLALAIFQFGRHFPQALKAGLAALHSYITAHSMEARLLVGYEEFWKNQGRAPTEPEFRKLLSEIPKEEAESFRKDVQSLFLLFGNPLLVEKILHIMGDVLLRMQRKTEQYTALECSAVELGIRILARGRELFQLVPQEVPRMVEAIGAIEKRYWEEAVLADGRSRTDTMLPSVDFESTASTNSTTSA